MKTYQVITNMSCNLRCTYCYEHLTTKVNDADKIKEYLLACMKRDSGKETEFNIDFIGGEPFFVVDLLDEVSKFVEDSYKDYGFKGYYLNFSTNGTLLWRRKQRKYLEKYKDRIYLGVSIDGDKEKHDLHRLTINGKGSFDDCLKGYNTAHSILGRDRINIKATFTKDTIKDYARSVKFLMSLGNKPSYLNANFNFEEKFDEYDGALIALEMINIFEYMFSQPREDWVGFTMLFEEGTVVSPRNTLVKEVAKKVESNRCGTCTNNMLSLGFEGKLYGCNRFLSMNKEGMDIGEVRNSALVEKENSIKSEVLNAYKNMPDSCNACLFNNICSDCVAIAPDEGISFKEYYSQHRQCGFTKAKEIVRDYLQQLVHFRKLKILSGEINVPSNGVYYEVL